MPSHFPLAVTKNILWAAMKYRDGNRPAAPEKVVALLQQTSAPVSIELASRVIEKLQKVMERPMDVRDFFPGESRRSLINAFYDAALVLKKNKPTPRNSTRALSPIRPSTVKREAISPEQKWEAELAQFLADPLHLKSHQMAALPWVRAVFRPEKLKAGHQSTPEEFWLRKKVVEDIRLRRLIQRALLSREKSQLLRMRLNEITGKIRVASSRHRGFTSEPTRPDTSFTFLRQQRTEAKTAVDTLSRRYSSRQFRRKK